MKKPNKKRFLKLASFLRTLKPEQFKMTSWVSRVDQNECGTVCCAAGWLPKVDPKNWILKKSYYDNIYSPTLIKANNYYPPWSLLSYFNITSQQLDYIFMGSSYNSKYFNFENPSPKQVANRITRFVNRKHK